MAAVSVLTSATLIYTASGTASSPDQVIVTNNSGNTVYLGKDATVTTATGIALATASTLGIEMRGGETLYGIAGGTSEVRVEGW